jgi:hypothetical protein
VVAVEIIPLVQMMQLVPQFVKRFTGHIDTLSPALYSSPRRDEQPCSTRSDSYVEREAGSAPLRLLLTAQPANLLFLDDRCVVLLEIFRRVGQLGLFAILPVGWFHVKG